MQGFIRAFKQEPLLWIHKRRFGMTNSEQHVIPLGNVIMKEGAKSSHGRILSHRSMQINIPPIEWHSTRRVVFQNS
jgi:hypothetical protein